MNERYPENPELPAPAVDGYLDMVTGFVNSGLPLTEELLKGLDHIDDQESQIIDQLDEESIEPRANDRWNAAWHNIGRIAAIKHLVREESPRKIGF